MKKEEKELLLKDLSARLPYGIKIHIEHDVFYDEVEPYDSMLTPKILDDFLRMEKLEVKPYLRKMSSMTKDERKELSKQFDGDGRIDVENIPYVLCWYFEFDYNSFELDWKSIQNVVDWLNAHHFDYRGLIEKGLALEAPEGIYNF